MSPRQRRANNASLLPHLCMHPSSPLLLDARTATQGSYSALLLDTLGACLKLDATRRPDSSEVDQLPALPTRCTIPTKVPLPLNPHPQLLERLPAALELDALPTAPMGDGLPTPTDPPPTGSDHDSLPASLIETVISIHSASDDACTSGDETSGLCRAASPRQVPETGDSQPPTLPRNGAGSSDAALRHPADRTLCPSAEGGAAAQRTTAARPGSGRPGPVVPRAGRASRTQPTRQQPRQPARQPAPPRRLGNRVRRGGHDEPSAIARSGVRRTWHSPKTPVA